MIDPTRNNIHGWRDVCDVACLRVPPYRWRRAIPLPAFRLGPYRTGSGCWVLRCGWWGIRCSQ